MTIRIVSKDTKKRCSKNAFELIHAKRFNNLLDKNFYSFKFWRVDEIKRFF